MPICPKCNTTIHTGAEDQCPACGYSLRRANAVFGANQVEFTRVVDAAGVLTHRDRMELLHVLEDLERNIPPVALCIYLTDHGNMQEFRTHAHWILNHAHIHHPSFGKREQARAIEDAELTERRPGEPRPQEEEKQPGWLVQAFQRLRRYVRNAMHPLPPPARQEWMLMLVLDVQLELACFSWGYMLDPYINPDKITSCIISARLQFRERAMVTALKRVMVAAVRQIAVASHRVNKNMQRSKVPSRSAMTPLVALFLGAGLLAATPASLAAPAKASKRPAAATASTHKKNAASDRNTRSTSARTTRQSSRTSSKSPAKAPAKAQEKPAKPTSAAAAPLNLQDDDVAEEVESSPAATAAPPATPPPVSPAPVASPAASAAGAAATYEAAPRWTDEDYQLLMSGRLAGCYNLLTAPRQAPAASGRASAARTENDESDTRVPGRYCPLYSHPEQASDLYDPQLLLSDIDRDDVAHVLRELNAHAPFRIYVSLFKAGQEIPSDLAVGTLVAAASQPCEYAVMLQYSLGDDPVLDLGYKEITPTDDQRREWALHAQQAVQANGGGVEGLIAAIRQVQSDIMPLSAGFRPITPESAGKARLIDLPMREKEADKKPSGREKMMQALESAALQPMLYTLAALLACGGGALALFLYLRRSGRLLDSAADYRLSSPYGAGVSRYVRYLEGKEATKEKKIF